MAARAIVKLLLLSLFSYALASSTIVQAQDNVQAAPDRAEGEGPFDRLVIRGATLIDGTGAPAIGPVDIVIEGNRIVEVRIVGAPMLDIDPEDRPEAGTYEIDATGLYVLPGFINAHAHISNTGQFMFGEAAPAEYAYKLWLAHGITTIREVGAGNGRDWTMNEKRRSQRNEITAPRINVHDRFRGNMTVDEAVTWVKDLAKDGADGIKYGGASPDLLA
ncbi:MAG: amidohydrolase family protein, partial [Sphingomonadales bacterium]